jgi:ABC-type nitrate/sulfonate/bicarbonate transport system permease component
MRINQRSLRLSVQGLWRNLAVLFIFASLWELCSRFGLISKLFFPPPSMIVQALFKMIVSGRITEHLTVSLTRILLGVILGTVTGVPLGILMGWSPRLQAIFDPLIAALHPIPKIAIFPIILIIFGIGESANIVVIAITAFFPAVVNSMTGVKHIDPVYFEVAQNYGANQFKTFTRVLLPGSLPMILSGIRLAINTGLLITIAVELVSAKRGLGVLIWFSWQTLRVEELYATLVVVALLGILFNAGLQRLSLLLVPWAQSENSSE